MRKVPHARINETAFDLHCGREPDSETSNLLKFDALKNKTDSHFSAQQDT